ncbi:MAG: L-threonylcarbamoyladenylate synthase, partial [Candidatus Omnitrophota bacterium]|nr:L-threonylcarbamoyladenylate synthase [Candidatus Omnitrophota bacterium]
NDHKTIVLKVNPKRPDKGSIKRAAEILRSGGLVGFPTETVYGLGVNLLNKEAIKKLYKVKARPKAKPFTAHIDSASSIKKSGCKVTRDAKKLIYKYWPGPLTIILKNKRGRKIGFRVPDNIVALELIRASRVPIAAPSANISGEAPPVTASGVLDQLDGRIDILLDAGPTDVGVESTVVDMTVTPPRVLREGAIGREDILSVIAKKL